MIPFGRGDTAIRKVKPEVATAVIELLMMGGKTPETCLAVNKRQDKKLENFCILLVIYFNKYLTSIFHKKATQHLEWHLLSSRLR
jgi:hypothetical protein